MKRATLIFILLASLAGCTRLADSAASSGRDVAVAPEFRGIRLGMSPTEVRAAARAAENAPWLDWVNFEKTCPQQSDGTALCSLQLQDGTAAAMFVDSKLASLDWWTDAWEYQAVRSAFEAKFGQPTEVTTLDGIQWLTWRKGWQSLTLWRKRCGSVVDLSCPRLGLLDSTLFSEYSRRTYAPPKI